MNQKLFNHDLRLHANAENVVVRPFNLAWQAKDAEPSRTERMLERIFSLDEAQVKRELAKVFRDFGNRHWQTRDIFRKRFEDIKAHSNFGGRNITQPLSELIGAYFCHEYSYASAALMNPSVTLHPDQSGMGDGWQRIIMSMRAVGEGHISSVAFREGVVGPNKHFSLSPEPPTFTAADLATGSEMLGEGSVSVYRNKDSTLSGTVLFPITDAQKNGLEDLRLTRIRTDDGKFLWVGTYTAYSGREIQSELLFTDDFRKFDLVPMSGKAAVNKGMALFPKKIGGEYAMIGRQDGENLFLLRSPNICEWNDGVKIMEPRYPWEYVQIGNCGPPIELDQGWLLLTHGVGAMRKYSIGAALLDKKDPSKVLGRTAMPILSADEELRDGYVPNVVYSCGAMKCGPDLFLPYGVADSSIAFAFMPIDSILKRLV